MHHVEWRTPSLDGCHAEKGAEKSREKKDQQYRIPQDADQKDVKIDGDQRCESLLVPSCQSVKIDAEKSGDNTILSSILSWFPSNPLR
jgi:hypothetical protein